MDQDIQDLENESSSETTEEQEEQQLTHPVLRYGGSNSQVFEEKEEMSEDEQLSSPSLNNLQMSKYSTIDNG